MEHREGWIFPRLFVLPEYYVFPYLVALPEDYVFPYLFALPEDYVFQILKVVVSFFAALPVFPILIFL